MQKFFSKIDKEILIILVALLFVLLLAGFAFYKYMSGVYSPGQVKVQNLTGGLQTETR